MTVLPEINRVNYFKELPFYNKPIEKPRIKHTLDIKADINLLAEFPFYKPLSVTKLNQAFKGHAISYKAEIIEKKILFYN